LDYTFSVSNLSPYPLNGVQAVITLPTGVDYIGEVSDATTLQAKYCRRHVGPVGTRKKPNDHGSDRRGQRSSRGNAVGDQRTGAVSDSAVSKRKRANDVRKCTSTVSRLSFAFGQGREYIRRRSLSITIWVRRFFYHLGGGHRFVTSGAAISSTGHEAAKR